MKNFKADGYISMTNTMGIEVKFNQNDTVSYRFVKDDGPDGEIFVSPIFYDLNNNDAYFMHHEQKHYFDEVMAYKF